MPINLAERAAERLDRDGGFGLFDAGGTIPMPDGDLPDIDAVPVQPRREGKRVSIDLVRLQRLGFVTPSGSRARISEEFRVIKRPLLLNAFAAGAGAIEHGNMIMVTSAVAGEGKTFTAVNLAMSLASERDLRVLLVDADMHRPSVMKTLGGAEQKGLLDVLSGTEDPSDVILRTSVPNLALMPAGSPSAATTELLASERTTAVMAELATRHRDRVVIFDAPPVLAASEASVLALHVGQTIVVVEAGHTDRRQIDEALSHVGYCPKVSIVLNKARVQNRTERLGTYVEQNRVPPTHS